MLNLSAALELYSLLAPYLPEVEEGQPAPEFILNMLGDMKNEAGSAAYREATVLLGGDPDSGDSLEVLSDFISGLSENEITTLKVYAEQLGL
jgi:hypothetical protein